MHPLRFLTCLTLLTAMAGAQTLREQINVSERVVTALNQSMTGTWLMELRRPGAPEGQAIPLFVVYLPDGAAVGVSSDGAQSGHAGVWTRVSERKFLQTMFLFGFNEQRTLATVTKVRINLQLAEDGRSATGTTEVVVLDRDGKVLNTIPGTTFTAIRLSAEKPGDFNTFQSQ